MELKMEIFSPNLVLLGILEVYQSVLWEEYAFKAGSFSLESRITPETAALLVPDNILWIAGETAGIIEFIEQSAGEDGAYIRVKGPLLTGLLARRILWGQYDLYGTAPAILHQLVQDCAIAPTRGDADKRRIPGLVADRAAPVGGEARRRQKTGGSLLEALSEIGEAGQTAFGVRFNAREPRMEFWARQGVDRSVRQSVNAPVFYSTELDDVLSAEYAYDSSEFKNVALVAGEGEGAARAYVTVNGEAEPEPLPPQMYVITVEAVPVGCGAATGGGTYAAGETVTVRATAGSDYIFQCWKESGIEISTEPVMAFTATEDRCLTATFAQSTGLPEGYTALRFIQSSGTQRINTGVYATTETRVVLDCEILALPDSTGGIFGTRDVNSTTAEKMFCVLLQSNSRFRTDYFGTSVVVMTIEPLQRLSIDKDKNLTVINGESFTNSAASALVSSAYPMGLFCCNMAGTFARPSKMKLYAMKIYDGGILQRDFIPCSTQEGEIGLYDLAEGKFYANSGTGAFIPG